MPFDIRSAALGLVMGAVGILLLGGSSLTQTICNPVPVDKSVKNKANEMAKLARFHGRDFL